MRPILSLRGLDGANPLGFMALLGVALISRGFCPEARIFWQWQAGGWRPQLQGFQGSESDFLDALFAAFKATSPLPFEINNKFPFAQDALRTAMKESQLKVSPLNRRDADLLAAFGTDAHADKDGSFLDTALRMVRSGDAIGQGLSAYAVQIRNNTTLANLRAALFSSWHYKDDEFSLRWDPLEDRRYALRWHDPKSQSKKKYSLMTMRAANALALEGMGLLPVQPQLRGLSTTGFGTFRQGEDFFAWPIWNAPISSDVIRSLLALPEITSQPPPRDALRSRGVVEVYRSEKIASNQYYKNLSPSHPA